MPTITRLERQKRRRGRVSVFIDGEFSFGVNEESALRFGLCPGLEMDDSLTEALKSYDLFVQGKLLAERYLAARMRSEYEVRRYLSRKDIPDDVIEETISTFRRVRLLNDEEYARAFVRDRLRLKPKATSMLRRELHARGISRDIVDTVLEEEKPEDASLVHELATQWLSRHRTPDNQTARRRLAGFLQRRGFSTSVIYDVLNEKLGSDGGIEQKS
jgi:regulatory protein